MTRRLSCSVVGMGSSLGASLPISFLILSGISRGLEGREGSVPPSRIDSSLAPEAACVAGSLGLGAFEAGAGSWSMPSWARAPAVIRRIATNKALAASPRPMAAARMAVIPWIVRRFIAAPAYGRPRGPGQPVSAPPRGWEALRDLIVLEVLGEHARGGGRFGPGPGRPGGLGRARGNGSSASSAV